MLRQHDVPAVLRGRGRLGCPSSSLYMSSTSTYTHRQKSLKWAIIRLVLLVSYLGWWRLPKLSHQGTFLDAK